MRALILSSLSSVKKVSPLVSSAHRNGLFLSSFVSSRDAIPSRPRGAVRASQVRHYHFDGTHNTDEPTIYALSTATGKAAIAVVRVSGPACRQVARPIRIRYDILPNRL